MPAAPRLGRGKHATTTAHVGKGTLTGSVRARPRDARHTGDGATGTPRLGRVLVTGLLGDCVGLSLVLGNVGVDKVDQVRADGGLQDSGQLDSVLGLRAIEVEYANGGASKL